MFQESGLLLTEDFEGPDKATYTYRPLIKNLWEMADESLKSISQALERLALTQSSSSWSRHMKTPDLFKPDTRDNEIKQWSDWKFSFVNYIKGIDARMAASMEFVEENLNGDFKLGDMTDETKMMAVRLYGVLTSYLRNRPLKLVKFMKDENGFEAWQRLLKEMQPATRARSLALLTQLSRVQFAEGRTLSEQLPQYEAIVQEYERISHQKYPDDAKIASVLQAAPSHLRAHLQLWISDTTKFEDLKDKIMELEAIATRWDSSNSLTLPTRAGMDESTPMEVDYVGKEKGKKGGKTKSKDQKGKSKGKEKGKMKSDGKGSWKSSEKGKSLWEGKYGHYAKECWKRANQVEEQWPASNLGGTSASSSSAQNTTGQAGQTAVKTTVQMVRLSTPPESSRLEIFDLTTPRDEDEERKNYPWRVGAIEVEAEEIYDEITEEDEVFMDCIEPVVLVPHGITVVAMDLQDDLEEKQIQMVSTGGQGQDTRCLVTLDSGADISVLPRSYGGVGTWSPGSQNLKMVDAQGTHIAHDGVTRAKIRTTDRNGKEIELVEDFVLGNVQHPILCAGKLLKKGWSICGGSGNVDLRHERRDISVPIHKERNSLQFTARISMVEAEEEESKKDKEMRIMALRGTLSRYVKEMEMEPGWHQLPNGVVAYSDPVATRLLDPRGQVEDAWKARMTLIKDKDDMWTQLENVADYTELGEKAFRGIGMSGPQRTLTFLAASAMEDYWEIDSEVPVNPFPEEKNRAPQGRLDWSEDDREEEEDLEMKMDARDIEKMVVADRPNEVELDEVIYTDKMPVKELQVACKERGLPYSGSKKRLLDRLMAFRINIENKMKLNIANKMFREQERKPTTIGQPRLPSLKEQEIHFVTHIPYAPWCQACVATWAKEDRHERQDTKPDLGKNVIQLDFFFTYTGEETRTEEAPMDKVKERADQYGTCLVMTSSETKAIHVVPVPSKGTASLKTVTEEIIRFSMENASTDPCIFQGGSERAMRQILRSVQQVRTIMGLPCETRLTGSAQHASNGQAERAVQTIRKMANCLRSFAESKAHIQIDGSFHMYPWAFRHAAFLVNRFRVLEKVGRTSHELATGHAYNGKLALYGETVLFKRLVKYKASGLERIAGMTNM